MKGLLEIKRNKDFDENIIPKIDALAAEQNKTRIDVIRDIMYVSSNYKPKKLSPENANETFVEQCERSLKRRIRVAVDMVYLVALYEYLFPLHGMELNRNSYLHQILYHYFGMEVPNNGSAEIPPMHPFDLSNPQPLRPIKHRRLQKQTEDYCPS